MKLQVKNLGAVKEATLDLSKPLTVFCGDNGTGKTYLASLVSYLGNLIRTGNGFFFDEEFTTNLIAYGEASTQLDFDKLWAYRKEHIGVAIGGLCGAFAVSEINKDIYFKDISIEVLEDRETFEQRILEAGFGLVVGKFLFEKKKSSAEIVAKNANGGEFVEQTRNEKIENIASLSLNMHAFCAFPDIFHNIMLPVERGAIFLFGKELSLAIKPNRYKDFVDFNHYPISVHMLLSTAGYLHRLKENKSDYYEFAEQIEQKLLGGQVIINEQGQLEFKTGRAKNVQVGFAQSASVVKTLGALIIFLKHQAVKGQMLIIDEPELNLHPRHQITLARIFAQLIQKGLRLLISTHSDYILRELNNLIMLGQDNEAVRAKAKTLGYEETEYIRPSDIGVYLFEYKEPTDEKVSVQALEIDAYGFDVESIDNATAVQNHNAETLYYALKYGEEIEND